MEISSFLDDSELICLSICIVIINFDMKYIPQCISLNSSRIGYLFLLKGDDLCITETNF